MYMKNNEQITSQHLTENVKTFPNKAAIEELDSIKRKNENFSLIQKNQKTNAGENNILLLILLILFSDSEFSFLPIILTLI